MKECLAEFERANDAPAKAPACNLGLSSLYTERVSRAPALSALCPQHQLMNASPMPVPAGAQIAAVAHANGIEAVATGDTGPFEAMGLQVLNPWTA